MDHYQQLDLQSLIDLLANETQEYTKAFTRGAPEEIAVRKTVMDALIAEIKSRKNEHVLPQNDRPVVVTPKESE